MSRVDFVMGNKQNKQYVEQQKRCTKKEHGMVTGYFLGGCLQLPASRAVSSDGMALPGGNFAPGTLDVQS